MIIEKTWFYDLSTIEDIKIEISKDIEVSIYDSSNFSREVYLSWNSKLSYFSLTNSNAEKSVNFYQNEENSELISRNLIISKDNKIKSRYYSNINSDKSKSDVYIVSIIWENWDIDLDWVIEISKWIKKVSGHLVEENLFLWEKWKVKWVPTLLVRSDDVEASHACRMERISDDKLFYLRSRWLWKDNAINLIIESYFEKIFSEMKILNEEIYNDIFSVNLQKIN